MWGAEKREESKQVQAFWPGKKKKKREIFGLDSQENYKKSDPRCVLPTGRSDSRRPWSLEPPAAGPHEAHTGHGLGPSESVGLVPSKGMT